MRGGLEATTAIIFGAGTIKRSELSQSSNNLVTQCLITEVKTAK